MASIPCAHLAIARIRDVSSRKPNSGLEDPFLSVVLDKDVLCAPVATRGKRGNFDYNQSPSVSS